MIYADKNCLDCNKEFTDNTYNQVKKFCNYYCKKKYTLARRRRERIKNIEKQCVRCGKTFIQKFIQEVKYCSRHCCDVISWTRFEETRKKRKLTDPLYREHNKQILKKWRENNKDKVRLYSKKAQSTENYKINRRAWWKMHMSNPENKEKRRKWRLNWYSQDHIRLKEKQYKLKNREKIREQGREYSQRLEVRNRRREQVRYKLKHDPIFKLKCNVRTRIRLYVRRGLAKKTLPTSTLIGCSWEFLKVHLEKRFKPNMNWNNYGKWHIDHHKAMAKFDLFKEKELLECCNYSNLRPLWAEENLRKGSR